MELTASSVEFHAGPARVAGTAARPPTRERWPEMATTAAHQQLVGRAAAASRAGRAGFIGTLRSEFTKIRSVRSTYWTLFALVVACVGIGALFSWGQTQQLHHLDGGRNSAARTCRRASRTVAAEIHRSCREHQPVRPAHRPADHHRARRADHHLGVLDRDDQDVADHDAAPRHVFAAKAIVFGAVALVVGLVTSFLAFFAGQAILSSQHVGTTLGQPDVLRAVIGGGLFLAVCGLLSFGIGAMLRHTAGAIAAAIGLMFVLWILSEFLPGPPSGWFGQADIDKWIPFNAGGRRSGRTGQRDGPVLAVDRVRGVLRLRGRRDHRRPGPVPPPRRVASRGGGQPGGGTPGLACRRLALARPGWRRRLRYAA